ncbi:MAG: DUF4252 domain-containing protein [Chryseolinea sp.]
MKKIILSTFIALLFVSASAFAQSESFVTLKDKFSGEDDVHHFAVSGFFARGILWMADEHEFYSAIKDVKNVRLIVIPREAFKAQDVTLNGFKKVLKNDGFEELVRVKDSGDDVTLYHQSSPKKNDRYFVIVEDNDEIVGIEIKGYIDPEFILANQPVAYNK